MIRLIKRLLSLNSVNSDATTSAQSGLPENSLHGYRIPVDSDLNIPRTRDVRVPVRRIQDILFKSQVGQELKVFRVLNVSLSGIALEPGNGEGTHGFTIGDEILGEIWASGEFSCVNLKIARVHENTIGCSFKQNNPAVLDLLRKHLSTELAAFGMRKRKNTSSKSQGDLEDLRYSDEDGSEVIFHLREGCLTGISISIPAFSLVVDSQQISNLNVRTKTMAGDELLEEAMKLVRLIPEIDKAIREAALKLLEEQLNKN